MNGLAFGKSTIEPVRWSGV